jgi:hypothetical protein
LRKSTNTRVENFYKKFEKFEISSLRGTGTQGPHHTVSLSHYPTVCSSVQNAPAAPFHFLVYDLKVTLSYKKKMFAGVHLITNRLINEELLHIYPSEKKVSNSQTGDKMSKLLTN